MKRHSQKLNHLRRERELRGWTQPELGDKIDAHWKTIGRWELGLSAPGPYHLRRLMEVFGKSIEELGFQTRQERQAEKLHLNEFSREDWQETLSEGPFYGRKKELGLLEQWIIDEHKGMILVSGLGGVGKTSLVTTLTKRIRSSFSSFFWYSLRAAPPFREFVNAYVRYLSPQRHVDLPEEQIAMVTYLLTWLQGQRSLLILDNFESVLQSGDHTGKYREGYEGYGLLLEQIGTETHQSCLLLTSREKPHEFARLESSSVSVSSLSLASMAVTDGRKLLKNQRLAGSETAWNKLIHYYSGNPLALKLIAGQIKELFGGDLAAFFAAEKTVFGDIYDLLERQFQRLSEQEQEIMYWLAVEQQPVLFQNLGESVVRPISKSLLLEVLASLRHRSLIETGYGGQYFLQSVIAEYVLEKLTKQIYYELDREQFTFFRRVALMQAQDRENIRTIQVRLILLPLLAMLRGHLGEQGSADKLRRILTLLHTHDTREHDYAASNLLHLLIHMQVNLRGLDYSALFIQQAYLRGVDLPEVNFSFASFKASTFTDTFGCIYCVAFNANGSLFAAGMTNGEVRLWRTSPLEPVKTFQGHIDGTRSIAFSPNGRLLASGSHDQTVRIWNVLTGDCQKVLSGHSGSIRSIAFHPDGQILASGSEDGYLLVYNINTGKCLKKLGGHASWILTIAFSPDGSLLVSGDEEGCIKIWEVASGRCVDTLSAHTFRIRSLAFAPGGDIFASSSDDRTIKMWATHARQLLYLLEEPVAHCTRSIAFSPDGKKLAAGGDDQIIYLWDLASKSCLNALQGHTNRIWSVAFHPENHLLLSGSEDQTVRLWDSNAGYCQHTLQGYRSMFWSVAFSPDNTLLSSGGEDGVCRIWEVATGRCLKTLCGHTNQIRCTTFSPDGVILASGSDDLTIRLWNVATAQPLSILRGHKHLVHSLAFHPDGKILVSGSHDKSIQLWDVNTGYPLASLPDHRSLIWSVAFNPDGRLIASGSEDKHLRIWDVKTRSCQALLQGHGHRIWAVAFSSDGQLVASGSDDQTIRIWRISDGFCQVSLQGHTHWVRTLAFSPDGKTLASGSHDMTIRLWDVSTGQCFATFTGHRSWIWSVTFSSDGEMIASGSDDGTIKLWDRYTGECLQTLRSERPYEDMNITGVKGLSEAQKMNLKALGAIDK